MPDDNNVTELFGDEMHYFSDDEALRFVTEMLMITPGMTEGELEAAFDELEKWCLTFTLISAWHQGRIKFGWNREQRELTLYPREEAS